MLALVLWSNKVVSISMPFDEGIVDLSVAVTANTLVNEMLFLVALMVNALGVFAREGAGAPPLDLEQEISELITIGKIIYNARWHCI